MVYVMPVLNSSLTSFCTALSTFLLLSYSGLLPFLEFSLHSPTLGPLHRRFPRPESILPRYLTGLLSLLFVLWSNIRFPMRPGLHPTLPPLPSILELLLFSIFLLQRITPLTCNNLFTFMHTACLPAKIKVPKGKDIFLVCLLIISQVDYPSGVLANI